MDDASSLLSAAKPVVIPVDAYVSDAYARAERDRLWRKVWLQAGRVSDLPEVGNYITYDIVDDSVLIVRTAADTIKAYHNVCTHRGRTLVDTPPGERNACGKKFKFVCGFHAWSFDIEGRCGGILQKDEWQGALTDARTHLGEVKVDFWGGFIWINLDPNCEQLRAYLEPAASMLDPFQLENMRCRWRKWTVFDCNWKVALEAFNETYHVPGTHPEFMRFGNYVGWAKAQGKHSNIGYDAPKGLEENAAKLRLGSGDPRTATAEMQRYTWEGVNTNTTKTLVDAAQRLKDELPEGTPAEQVLNTGSIPRGATMRRAASSGRLLMQRTSRNLARLGRYFRTSSSGTRSTTCCAIKRARSVQAPTNAFSRSQCTSSIRRARLLRQNGSTQIL